MTGYEVRYRAASAAWDTVSAATTSTAITGLTTGTYDVMVRAKNDEGFSPWSDSATGRLGSGAQNQQESPGSLTASLVAPVTHDEIPFTVSLEFSEPVSTSYRTLRDHAITATNGDVTGVQRVDGSSAVWKVTVAPSSREDVELNLSGGSDPCGEGDSVCTGDGRRLENQYRSLILGPSTEEPQTQTQGAGLTADLDAMPESHDGTPFAFGLTFSEEPAVSYRTLRDSAFDVTGGEVQSAGRQQQGSDLRWTITVEPETLGPVTVSLPATTDCAATGAICTSDGVQMSNPVSAIVRGPASGRNAMAASYGEGNNVTTSVPALPLAGTILLGALLGAVYRRSLTGAFPISRSRAHTHRRHGHPLQTVPSAGLIERPQEKNRVDALR